MQKGEDRHVYGMTALQAFATIEFWLMVAIGFLVVGCGLMVINNIGTNRV